MTGLKIKSQSGATCFQSFCVYGRRITFQRSCPVGKGLIQGTDITKGILGGQSRLIDMLDLLDDTKSVIDTGTEIEIEIVDIGNTMTGIIHAMN